MPPGPRAHQSPSNSNATTFAAESSGAKNRETLEMGAVYTGVIFRAYPRNIYTVELDSPKVQLTDCMRAPAIFCSLLGTQMRDALPAGTPVMVLASNPPYIISCRQIPGRYKDTPPAALLADGEVPQTLYQDGLNAGTTGLPPGMLEGEHEIAHSLGSAIQFMTTLLKLKGGERAAVEAHMAQDMVRIFSETFKRFDAFGEFVSEPGNGRINVIWKGTGYDHESWGVIKENDPRTELPGPTQAGDPKAATGRWRMEAFAGFLGDFINLVLKDPEEALGAMAQQAAGKLRVHAGQDGTLLVQSVADIVLERVHAIPVPVQTGDPNSLENAAKDMATFEQNFLRIYSAAQTDRRNMPALAFHLREYSRWLSQMHSWQRFLQRDDLYTMESEAEAVARQPASYNCGETDKKNAGAGAAPMVYSTVRINRDGSIALYDGYGAAVVLARGNAHVTASRDLLLEAAGDVRIQAGRNIFMSARRNVEISALTGAICTVARTAWRALCTWGAVHIRSDADEAAPKTQEQQPQGAADPVVSWNPARQPAILLEAPQAGLALSTNKNQQFSSKAGGFDLIGAEALKLQGLKSISATLSESIKLRVPALHAGVEFLNLQFSQFLNLGQRLVLTTAAMFHNGAAYFQLLQASASIRGPSVGPQPVPNVSSRGVGAHLNHILPLGDDPPPAHNLDSAALLAATPDRVEAPFREGQVRWDLPGREEHSWDSSTPIPPQSLSQSQVESAAETTPENYGELTPEALENERLGSNKVPFYGPASRQWVLDSELPPLNSPCDVPPSELPDVCKGAMTAGDIKFRYRRPTSNP